jgi:hypothetical protein
VPASVSVLLANVKLALSSSSPSVPLNVILVAVKSSIFTLANVVCPLTSSVVEIVCAPVTASVLPLNVKLALSSIAPAVPANTTLPLVRSLIVALARVYSPVTPSVVLIVAAPVMLVSA